MIGFVAPIPKAMEPLPGVASMPSLPPPPPRGRPVHPGLGASKAVVGILIAVVVLTAVVAVSQILPLSSPCHRVQELLGRPDLGQPIATPGAALDETLVGAPADWKGEASFSEDLNLAATSAGDFDRIQRWKQSLATSGFTRGWRKLWLPLHPAPGASSIAERVYEFRTPEGAQTFQRWASEDSCRFAQEAFQPPGLQGAVGLRQVFGQGQGDQVTFVAENRRYVAAVTSASGPPSRDLLLQVLRYLVDRVTKATVDAEPCREIAVYGQVAIEAGAQWSARPIERLVGLLPSRAPLGFTLVSTKLPAGSTVTRTWTDGVSELTSSVTQFGSVKEAVGWIQKNSSAVCGRAAAVADVPAIPGSILVMDQEPQMLIQRIVFLRGSRGYELELAGPPSETPGEILQTLARRANVVAR